MNSEFDDALERLFKLAQDERNNYAQVVAYFLACLYEERLKFQLLMFNTLNREWLEDCLTVLRCHPGRANEYVPPPEHLAKSQQLILDWGFDKLYDDDRR